MLFSGKTLKLLAFFLLICLSLQGCSRLVPDEEVIKQPNIYASFYPLWAFTSLLTADTNAQVHCLVQPQDGCLRSYTLSDRDLSLLAYAADVVVAGGRGLESFESQLYALGSAGPVVITAFSELPLYNEADGTLASDESTHFDGANPHLYMSVRGASDVVGVIAENLAVIDPENAAIYASNLENISARLEDLLAEMQSSVQKYSSQPVILFNEALVYLAQDLSLEVAGWCERESTADLSENELTEWLGTDAASSAQVILIEKQAPAGLVKALEEKGYSVAQIDIFSDGRTDMGTEHYFSAQRANAQAIATAFDKIQNSN